MTDPGTHTGLVRSFVGRLFISVSSYLITVLLGRGWGTEGVAAFGLGTTYAAFALMFADLGINTAAMRWFVDAQGSLQLYEALWRRKLLLYSLVVAVSVGLLLAVKIPGASTVGVLVFFAAECLRSVYGLSASLLRASGRLAREVGLTVLERASSLMGIAAFAAIGTPLAASALFVLGAALALTLALQRAARSVSSQLRVNISDFSLRQALPYAGALALETIAYRIDMVLLPRYANLSDVGAYVAAYRPIFTLAGLAASAQVVYLPVWLRSHLPSGRLMRPDFILLLSAAVGLGAFSVFLFVPGVIELVMGNAFASSVPLMRILSFSALTVPIYYAVSATLIAGGKSLYFLGGWAIAAAVNLALNIALLPTQGVLGAAIATAATDSCLLLTWTGLGLRSGSMTFRSCAIVVATVALGGLTFGASR